MGPVLRISGRDVFSITVDGLSSKQEAAIRDSLTASDNGAGLGLAPFFSPSRSMPVMTLSGTRERIKQISRIISASSGFPAELSKKIDSLLDNYVRSDYKIDCRGTMLILGGRTRIMGILNVTPDSFSDGGLFADAGKAISHARDMAAAGADIIDIGGESTRPGSEPLAEEEELRRIIPLIERLSKELAVPISVDTYKASVAKKALDAGASIVNDISGLRFSPDMAKVVAEYGAAVIIMHIKGTPRNMQQNPVYDDVIGEIMAYLEEGIAIAERAGVDRNKTLIDPGIGFGKTLEHNLAILNRLDAFRALGRPIVLGTSRKKFIGKILEIPIPEQRIEGTAATVAIGIERGASIVRVHDVAHMARIVRMTDAIVKPT
ncbi:MAG TPA: dihydropteroate synthase [Nitrospirota bacterium]|nr:dihydropteroate synthase [Nitrospirota bacterium]